MDTKRNELRVRVNGELELDAGWWEQVTRADGTIGRQVHPPTLPMYRQVIHYLAERSEWERASPKLNEEAFGIAALCIRWGSYFAVLADESKPLWARDTSDEVAVISDDEIARINIEASEAFRHLISLRRIDGRVFNTLVEAASHLPMPFSTMPKYDIAFGRILRSGLLWQILGSEGDSGAQPSDVLGTVSLNNADRVLANAIVNECWRRNNQGLDALHSGAGATLPLTQRRLTCLEISRALRNATGHLKFGMTVVDDLVKAENWGPWPDRVVAYLRSAGLSPTGWSVNEETRLVWLSESEP